MNAERVVEARIIREGFYKWKYAEAVDVATGIKAEAKNYESKSGAKEHARISRPFYWIEASSAKIE